MGRVGSAWTSKKCACKGLGLVQQPLLQYVKSIRTHCRSSTNQPQGGSVSQSSFATIAHLCGEAVTQSWPLYLCLSRMMQPHKTYTNVHTVKCFVFVIWRCGMRITLNWSPHTLGQWSLMLINNLHFSSWDYCCCGGPSHIVITVTHICRNKTMKRWHTLNLFVFSGSHWHTGK